MKSREQVNAEFDDKFEMLPKDEVSGGGYPLRGWEDIEVKSHISSIRQQDIESLEEWVKEKSYFIKPNGNIEDNNGQLLHKILKKVVSVEELLAHLKKVKKKI